MMKKHLLMLAVASCFVATQASAMSAQEHKVAKEKIEAAYKVDKAKCDGMKDNAKDVCMKEAKAAHVHATSDAKAKRKSAAASADAREDKMEANYKVAKEKCDAMSGDAKDSCIRNAKAKYHQ